MSTNLSTDSPPKTTGVALFGMPYLYQARDFDFHMEMLNIGLFRGNPLISGLSNKAIVANAHEYWLCDYDDEAVFCNRFGFVATYTVDDFVAEIKKIKGYGK